MIFEFPLESPQEVFHLASIYKALTRADIIRERVDHMRKRVKYDQACTGPDSRIPYLAFPVTDRALNIKVDALSQKAHTRF